MKNAQISNNVVTQVFAAIPGFTLDQCFHADVLAGSVPVPDNVEPGWIVNADGAIVAPEIIVPEVKYASLTPMSFYLSFTPTERIAIKKSSDPVVEEFWATYELAAQTNSNIDPNLVSVQESLAYLAIPTTATPPGPGILTSTARIAQISNGVTQ